MLVSYIPSQMQTLSVLLWRIDTDTVVPVLFQRIAVDLSNLIEGIHAMLSFS